MEGMAERIEPPSAYSSAQHRQAGGAGRMACERFHSHQGKLDACQLMEVMHINPGQWSPLSSGLLDQYNTDFLGGPVFHLRILLGGPRGPHAGGAGHGH